MGRSTYILYQWLILKAMPEVSGDPNTLTSVSYSVSYLNNLTFLIVNHMPSVVPKFVPGD